MRKWILRILAVLVVLAIVAALVLMKLPGRRSATGPSKGVRRARRVSPAVSRRAKMLVEQNTNYGKVNQAMLGSSAVLVRQGKIAHGRRYTMPDKIEIDVWILKASPKALPQGTVLAIHALGDAKIAYLMLAKLLAEKGFNVVLADLRAHGRSTGRYVTYGALEKHDQRRVIDALYEEKLISEPLLAFGVSLGGSVAIQYAAVDPRVKGVMAMAPPKDLKSVARKLIDAPNMSDEDLDDVLARAGEIGKFDPAAASTLEAIAKVRCPVLLVHGKLDKIVPYTDSEELKKAAGGPVELELIPLAGHIGMLFGREAKIVADLERLAAKRPGTPSG